MKRFKLFGAGLAAVVAMTSALVLGTSQPVAAAVIPVADGEVGVIPNNGRCGLIEAILNANADLQVGGNTDCQAGGDADIIQLAAGSTYELTVPYVHPVDGVTANGLPVIEGILTIEGNDATIARPSAALPFRFLQLDVGASLTIDRLTLTGGSTSGTNGGAIFANDLGATIEITNSTISDNSAPAGGAIAVEGTLTIENSTISGNIATFGSGGISASNAGITITNSTISGNSSATGTAALFVADSATATISSSTFFGNVGSSTIQADGAVTSSNSIISGSTPACVGTLNAAQTTLVTDGSCGPATIVNQDALGLAPLAANGGPTQTHALLAGSPAIHAATGTCPATDQRGVSRPQGSACDVGAFEYVPPAPPAPGPTFSRVDGVDRYATAAAVSAATFSPGVDSVFVVTGDDYPDGLTAGAVAGSLEVPVLLVRTGSIPTATAAELTRLAPGEIVVVGGPTVIGDTVLAELDAYTDGSVIRIFGPNRYATAAAVSAEYVAPGVDEVYVATGADFADALTAAAAAGANDAPVLLVSPTGIPTATATELTRLAPDRITLIGGPTAIADSVESALAPFASTSVTRVFGADRYGTAAAVSAHAFSSAATVHLATGLTFPDALAAGPAAAMAPGPILLSRTTCIPTVTDTEIDRLEATRVVLLGGTTALATPVATGTTCP